MTRPATRRSVTGFGPIGVEFGVTTRDKLNPISRPHTTPWNILSEMSVSCLYLILCELRHAEQVAKRG
jgi:hypothetical protein